MLAELLVAAYCVAVATFAGVAISLGYHRLLTHRSYKTYKWLEYALVTIGLPTGTPLSWVASHRAHHAFSDRDGDPRSIQVHGFWYAQTGKYFRSYRKDVCIAFALSGVFRLLISGLFSPHADKDLVRFARDVQRDPYYSWISRPLPYFFSMVTYFVALTLPVYLLDGWAGLLALHLTTIVIFNFGDASDTLTHSVGRRNPGQWHHGTDLGWYALLTMGDGWHAGHHSFPESARHGLLPGQFDAAWNTISLMRRLGMAWDVNVPTTSQIAEMTRTAPSVGDARSA